MSTAAIVLQARMGSQRLPGKTLAALAGRTVLDHCVERLGMSGLPVVLATTERAADDCLAREGERLGAIVVRGPDEDVLARFVLAASQLALTDVVRATADNPAVDLDAPRRVLEWRRHTGADHVVEDGLPYGATVEAFSAEALRRQAALATDAHDREHVTPFMRRDARFTAVLLPAPEALRRPELRLTVDTADDLAFVQRLFEEAERRHPRPAPLAALIAAADRLKGIASPAER